MLFSERSEELIAGVAGGVGVSLIAAALCATDIEVSLGGPVDVLVCRLTAQSLDLALQTLPAATSGGRPVLAVVHDRPPLGRRAAQIPRPIQHQVAQARARTHVVEVPFVKEWLTCPVPEHEVALLHDPGLAVPRHLREFAKAMTALRAALGGRSAPPSPASGGATRP